MANISHFPRYSQKENIVTNNTLLLMEIIYDYNSLKFGRFLAELGDQASEIAESFRLRFNQQEGTGVSVLDGLIVQESIRIIVETKLNVQDFSLDQLVRHLSGFGTEAQHRMLILVSPGPGKPSKEIYHGIGTEIPTLHVTFEEILAAAEKCISPHDEDMHVMLADFAAFCSHEGLLPRDRFTMFTPPCGQSFEENIKYELYYCPRSWNRRASRYLGIYSNKSVQRIGQISKIVDCKIDVKNGIVGECETELSAGEHERLVRAALAAKSRGWDISDDHRFYLCDEMFETDFRKTSPGGIQGHRYFDLADVLKLEELPCTSEIGALLKGRPWPQ